MSNARSIHIGLNHVNPDCYNGWDGELAGCINDATDMQAIADSLGYQSLLLTDSDATADRVVQEIGQAAQDLQSGDILLLSYSGHGGQVDDVNGDELDGQDETWVLWDRQLIDDELYALWSRFAGGVRIVTLSDSCHSGTVVRMLATLQDLSRQMSRSRAAPSAAERMALDSLAKALDVDPRHIAESTSRSLKRTDAKRGKTARSRGAPLASAPATTLVPRRVPADIQELINATRSKELAAAQFLAGPAERATIGATVILISGCQDDQLSADGAGNGLFTEKLKLVWNDGAFSGNYKDFWSAIRTNMPAKQQPNYMTVGVSSPGFEAQSPFEIEAGASPATPAAPPADEGQPAVQPAPETPASSGTRRTLCEGDTGGDVEYLQSRLVELGYNLDVDGSFGWATASAVRAFQSANGLAADGIVGPGTWVALEECVPA